VCPGFHCHPASSKLQNNSKRSKDGEYFWCSVGLGLQDMLCSRYWQELQNLKCLSCFGRKWDRETVTYYSKQATLPIVKKCGVFESNRSIFNRLPQSSQLLSLQNCSSNRTGSSAKDLICTRTMITSSQHVLLTRILLDQISTYTSLARQKMYCIRHTFVV
jgi:hypothetical protein